MKLPVIEFDENAHKFNKDSYAMEQKLPPLNHVSKNQKNIPFEEILPNQYKGAAKMYSFKTDQIRLVVWIKSLPLRNWKQIGEDPNYMVNWNDKRPTETRDEIQIDIDILDKPSKQIDHRIYTITIHLGTGTITVQGAHYKYFGSSEFPALKKFVDKCVNFTPENKSENNTTIPKTIEITTAQISLEDHDELNMVEDIHVAVPKTIDSNYQDACAQDLNPDSLMSDSTILNINTNNAGLDLTDSNTETFHTPAKMGEHILDFNTLQLQRCMAENTPKFKTKKNPNKEIRKIWEKLEEQSKFNEKIVNMTNLLQKEYCELIVTQQSVKSSSIHTSLTDQIKTVASNYEGKDQIIKELKSCISEKNNIIYNLKEQLTNQDQIILAFKDEQSNHDQIIACCIER